MNRFRTLWAAAFLLFSLSSVRALVIPLELEELVLSSDLVVYGKVTDLGSAWNENNSLIYTTVTLQPLEILKDAAGESRPTVVFRVLGGTVGTTTLRVHDNPKFAPGEEVLVCLETKNKPWPNLVGAYQGKFSLSGQSLPQAGVTPLSLSKNNFLERVRSIVRDQRP